MVRVPWVGRTESNVAVQLLLVSKVTEPSAQSAFPE